MGPYAFNEGRNQWLFSLSIIIIYNYFLNELDSLLNTKKEKLFISFCTTNSPKPKDIFQLETDWTDYLKQQ